MDRRRLISMGSGLLAAALLGVTVVGGTDTAWARPSNGNGGGRGGNGGGNAGGVPAGKVRKTIQLTATADGAAVGADGSVRVESWLRKKREFLRVRVKATGLPAGEVLDVMVTNPANGTADGPAEPVLLGQITLEADSDADPGSTLVEGQIQRRSWGGGPQRGFPTGIQPVAGITVVEVKNSAGVVLLTNAEPAPPAP